MTTNETEFPYKLSLHASKMLVQGIYYYHEDTQKMFQDGEDSYYCFLRAGTAIKEAKQLKDFCIKSKAKTVSITVDNLDFIIEQLMKDKEIYHDVYKKSIRPTAS
jgi:hypothetical protein